MNKKKKIELSRFMGKLLRHQPEIANIKIDYHGWTDVNDFIYKINKTKFNGDNILTIDLLEEIIQEDKKTRYSFNDDKTKIRANQGQSIKVSVDMEERMPPEILYHGTAIQNVESIDEIGLIKKKRLYVHMTESIEIAYESGKRFGRPFIYIIESKKMYDDGCRFLISSNNVWQIEAVPPKYLKKIGYID